METFNRLFPALVLAACALCLVVWLVESSLKDGSLRDLWRRFRSLPLLRRLLAALLAAALFVYGSTKPSGQGAGDPASASEDAASGGDGQTQAGDDGLTQAADEGLPPPSGASGQVQAEEGGDMQAEGGEPPPTPRLSADQYLAGFALVRVATNAASWAAAPSNAVTHAPWARYGVAEDTFWIPATNWSFTLGTNAVDGLHVSSSGTLSFGVPKGSPRARGMPDGSGLSFLAPLQTSLGTVPPGGRLWHAATASGSLLVTWQDVYANRDNNYPVSFQSELSANGDFAFRYAFTGAPPLTNFVIGAQHGGGGETWTFGVAGRLFHGLELRWRAFGLLDPEIDDHDGDGLSTYDEIMLYDGDPRLPDTDLDGLPDAAEALAGTRLDLRDSDGDGIPDGSDPAPLDPDAADADGDGLPDVWEIFRFGSTNATDSAAADSDTDGFGNLAEMLIGSDPAFAACAVSASGGHHAFTWTGLPDAAGYTLSVASNGVTVWSLATNACALTLTNAFLSGARTLTVVSSGGATSHTATVPFATPAAPNLTAWKIADPFAIDPSGGCTSLVGRTFAIGRTGGWQQYFVSSSPDGAAPWSLEGMRLEWADSGGASGSATASPPGDSLRLALSTNGPQTLTVRLVATGTNALARSVLPLHLLGWSPAVEGIAGEGATLAPGTNGPVLAAVTDLGSGTTAASFAVDRRGRPCNAPPGAAELAGQSDPFAPDAGARFSGGYGAAGELEGGTLLAGAPGIFPLPGPGGGNAPASGGGASQPGSPAPPPGRIALFAPVVTQTRGGTGCPPDGSDGYPFDAACLREAFDNARGFSESTGLSVSLGGEALDELLAVTVNGVEGSEYLWQGGEDSACVAVSISGVTAWECDVEREPGYSYDCAHAWDAECGGCGDCASGDCGGTEGDSLGSLRFRVPLGFTGRKRLAGFVWFVMETPAEVTPALFRVDAAPGVALSYGNPGGALSRALCEEAGGRDIVLAPVTGGVRLSVRDAGAPAEEFAWTVTGSGSAVTLIREDAAANVLRHATYSRDGDTWTRADHLAGAAETLASAEYPPENEWDAWERFEERGFAAGGPALSRTRVWRTLVGAGEAAAWRETARHEWDGAAGAWRETWMSYLRDSLNPLVNGLPETRVADDGSWETRAYDGRGRETLRREPLDGSDYWGSAHAATATSYDPPPGDGADWRDGRKPRTVSRYAVRGGVSNLLSREWRVYTRGTNDGWPALTLLTVRAASPSAAFGDVANARSALVTVADDDEVPVLMRGRPLREERADGALRTWAYRYEDTDSDGIGDLLEITARAGTAALPDGLPGVSTYTVERLDAVFGRLLYRETRLFTDGTGDPVLDWESRQYDAKGRHIGTSFSDGTSEENIWSCCRLESSRSRDGSYREHLAVPGFDGWSAAAEPSLGALPGADGRYPVIERFTDAIGRETNAVRCVWHNGGRDPAYAPLATRTGYPYGTDGYVVTTDPRGVETVRRGYIEVRAGKTCRVDEDAAAGVTNRSVRLHGGDAVEERFWDGGWTRQTRSVAYGADGCRIDTVVAESSDYPAVTNSVTAYDFLGRVARVLTPAFGGGWLAASNVYDGASSRVVRSTRTGSPATLYQYDALGNPAATALDIDGDGVFTDADLATATALTHEQVISGDWWRVTARAHSRGGVTNGLGVTREQVTGLSPALLSRTVAVGANGAITTVTRAFEPGSDVIAEVSQADSAAPVVRRTLYGRELESAGLGSAALSGYDGFARISSRTVTNGAGTVSTSAAVYGNFGEPVTNTTTYGSLTAVTVTGYDGQGRAVSETDPLGNTVFTAYDSQGAAISRSGATYPVNYAYDTAGRMASLATTRDGAAWDVTQWIFDPATGLATNKVYADASRIHYNHTPDGKPLRTAWARGVWRESGYTADGLLSSVTYGDATPPVGFAYDAFRRLSSASNSVAQYACLNSSLGVATNETATLGGDAFTLTRTLADRHRLTSLSAGNAPVHYGYDAENRLATVSNNVFAINYTYTPDGWDAGYTLTLTNGTTLSRALTRDAYRRQLVTAITNAVDGVPVTPLAYSYDLLDRVTNRNADAFVYNARSEVTAATIHPGNTNRYEYDVIGNKRWTSLNLSTNTYSANALNQYTNIADGSTIEPEYDLDGNLTWDGRFDYVWDAENRLTAVYSNNLCIVSNAYDHMSRRVLKATLTATHTFVYDGWNLVAEVLSPVSGVPSTNLYVWGKDLSGSLQGAGGVGGLLAVSIGGAWCFPLYDNNGNITTYVDESGTVAAEYAYNAFGKTIAQCGPMADAFDHRFSTKYFDFETSLYYYGYRYYSPELGRWLSRDPIEEEGGDNLYSFCRNDCLITIDYLGLSGYIMIASIETGEHKGVELGKTAWIEYVADCDRTFSFGVALKKGVLYNLHNYGHADGPEKRLGINQSHLHDTSATHTRMAYIDDDAEEKLWKYIRQQRDLGPAAWNYLHNCTGFASVAWKEATDEFLDPSHGKIVGNEISDKQLDAYLDGIGVSNLLRDVIKGIIKGLPMNTPRNLAGSILDANGGNKTEWKK